MGFLGEIAGFGGQNVVIWCDICGAVDALPMAGEEQQELGRLALSVWEQSSDVRDLSGFFLSGCPCAAGGNRRSPVGQGKPGAPMSVVL